MTPSRSPERNRSILYHGLWILRNSACLYD
ncbi:hypothetical protein EMO89_03525 [Bifidobacterium tissieri]|uniref:Uncharacterized protein n=1 Tax=Bifidobacterium tissieri TaxID=1630162 RepID=A0A5N0A1J8_9BIFI|nr:hypothetical protein EMO89_03525 [Bifidobacterium tissieri]KAA8833383.1 hypothetical protein EM849_00615 [Bifidobacterium tissieri]